MIGEIKFWTLTLDNKFLIPSFLQEILNSSFLNSRISFLNGDTL